MRPVIPELTYNLMNSLYDRSVIRLLLHTSAFSVCVSKILLLMAWKPLSQMMLPPISRISRLLFSSNPLAMYHAPSTLILLPYMKRSYKVLFLLNTLDSEKAPPVPILQPCTSRLISEVLLCNTSAISFMPCLPSLLF